MGVYPPRGHSLSLSTVGGMVELSLGVGIQGWTSELVAPVSLSLPV